MKFNRFAAAKRFFILIIFHNENVLLQKLKP